MKNELEQTTDNIEVTTNETVTINSDIEAIVIAKAQIKKLYKRIKDSGFKSKINNRLSRLQNNNANGHIKQLLYVYRQYIKETSGFIQDLHNNIDNLDAYFISEQERIEAA